MNKFYSAKEIVEKLGISIKTLNNWVKSGIFPSPIKIGRRTKWEDSTIDEYLKSKRAEKNHGRKD